MLDPMNLPDKTFAEQNIIGDFPWKIAKNRNKVLNTLPVVCLLGFYRFSELLEAVLGDFLH